VFVDEQRVPADVEMDERDAECVHWLAWNDREEPVGTARLDVAKGGKIGRLAVLASERRTGVGRALMGAVQDLARQRGLARVWCNAQVSAVPFYRRLGYCIESEPFDEAGIEHVRMALEL
jgi:predicted GNAT family N-acyltransferase